MTSIKIACKTATKSPINEAEISFPTALQSAPLVGDFILGYVDTKVKNVRREAIEFIIVKVTHTELVTYLTVQLPES